METLFTSILLTIWILCIVAVVSGARPKDDIAYSVEWAGVTIAIAILLT